MNKYLSELDLNRFGIVTAKADEIETYQELDECLSFCKANKVKLLIARLFADKLHLAQKLEASNAFLCDTIIYYELLPKNVKKLNEVNKEFTIRNIKDEDKEVAIKIAHQAFSDYQGHYHADPRLSKNDCDDTYASWCELAINNKNGDYTVLVTEDKTGVCAFLSLRIHGDNRLELVLSGVDRRVMGHGVYRRMIEAGVEYGISYGVNQVFTHTQITNFAVQKTLVSQGFIPVKYIYTFHKWFDSEDFQI